MDIRTIEQYENYVKRFSEMIFHQIAIKLAAFEGFNESLKKDFKRTSKSFPLLYFIVESLQVDCVLTVSKVIEDDRGDKTIQKFINFLKANSKKIQKKYPKLNDKIIQQNEAAINGLGDSISRILTQRDKYYAHSDNQYFLEPEKIVLDFPDTFEDLVKIIRTLQNMINDHYFVINNGYLVCMSDFAYMNTYKTIELLKEASQEWYKKYRPNEEF